MIKRTRLHGLAVLAASGFQRRLSLVSKSGEQPATKRLSTIGRVSVLLLLAGALPAPAQPHDPLQYHGGPVLRTFTIYPLYYGNWSNGDIVAQQNYLFGLADYMSGKNAPSNQQPMMRQYGVNTATVAPASTASPTASPAKLSNQQVLDIIHANQMNGNLPGYSGTALLIVFLAHSFSVDVTGGCAYHGSETPTSYFAAVPLDCGPLFLVTAHEVFESSADPAIGHGQGWDEAVDNCNGPGFPFPLLSFPGVSLPGYAPNTLPIPSAADNTQGGTCSTTGYTNIVSWEPCGKDDCGITVTPLDSRTTRIDLAKPVVTQASFPYNSIVFMSGDQVAIGAKGCVQTGGSGLTWKRYVDPSGPNSDRLYFGSMEIPGVLMPMRFSVINGQTIKVPTAEPPAKLVLYYSDDAYGDNGYYAHDNGTESQCFCPSLDATHCGVGTPGGPALVTLTITHNVPSPLTIGTASIPNGQVGVPYSQTLIATGGATPYKWELMTGRLPAGLLLNASGQISGIPTNAVAGTTLTFKVTDSTSPMQTATVTFTLTIAPAPAPSVGPPAALTVATTSLPDGQVGMIYFQPVLATGGTPPYHWALTGGGALPGGLTLDPLTGQISGTPSAAVTSMRLIFSVTDSTAPVPQTAYGSLRLTITP